MNSAVIAHYKNNLDWTNDIDPNLKTYIYSKTTPDPKYIYYPLPQGQEINVYLKFILDHYDNLPEKTLFLHDHKNSWHQEHDSNFICNHVKWDFDDYFSVNKRSGYEEISWINPPHARQFRLLKMNWEFLFDKYFEFPSVLGYYMGGQFVVSKSLILNYPKTFYQNCLNWINFAKSPMTPEGNVPGQLFEWMWNYIFTKNLLEKKYEYSQIFNL